MQPTTKQLSDSSYIKLMILLKDHTFVVGTSNTIIVQGRRDFQCGSILPDWLSLKDQQVFVAPPLQTEVPQLDVFARYFGPQGVAPVSLEKTPLFNDVYTIIPRDEQTLPVAVFESVKDIPDDKISVIQLYQNEKRNLFDKERKKCSLYANKAALHQDPNMKRKYQQWADRSFVSNMSLL